MKKNNFRLVAAFLTLALAGGVSTSTGCGGGSISTFCEDFCDCAGCKGNELQACKDGVDKQSDDAAAAGCGSELDDVITCTNAHFSCQNGGDVGPFAPGCDAVLAALAKCSKKQARRARKS